MPSTIWCDNLSVVDLSDNHVLHARTKHMEIDIFFHDLVLQRQILINHLFAAAQVADVFTKLLYASRFLSLAQKLNVCFAKSIGLGGGGVKQAH